MSSGARKGRKASVLCAAWPAATTRRGWWGGALSQPSNLGTAGRTWPNASTKAAQSSGRLRWGTSATNSPVAALRAPCTTRRALRPEITTTRCSPRRAHPARSGGYSRSVVSSPNHPSPPAATMLAACSATAFLLCVGRVGPTEHEFGALPAPAEAMQGAADGPLGHPPAALAQLGAQQRHRPARRRIPVRLGVALRQQRVQRRLRARVEPARLARMLALRDAGNPLRPPGSDPVVHARLRAIQGLRDRRDGYPLRAQQHRLKAPPVPHRAAPRLGRVQRRTLIGCHGEWHRLPSRLLRPGYHLNPLSPTPLSLASMTVPAWIWR